jgi:hypothetical protein
MSLSGVTFVDSGKYGKDGILITPEIHETQTQRNSLGEHDDVGQRTNSDLSVTSQKNSVRIPLTGLGV